MWGVGTAIGELPPYFMARTARLSGQKLEELEEEEEDKESFWYPAKQTVKLMVERVGFFGILACASVCLWSCSLYQNSLSELSIRTLGQNTLIDISSIDPFQIPNPLFDIAGFACGHFLIPFWTFFGATMIGKAIIKVHIQMLFVIVAFNEHHFEYFVDKIK